MYSFVSSAFTNPRKKTQRLGRRTLRSYKEFRLGSSTRQKPSAMQEASFSRTGEPKPIVHSVTCTPRQKATYPFIDFAASFGSG